MNNTFGRKSKRGDEKKVRYPIGNGRERRKCNWLQPNYLPAKKATVCVDSRRLKLKMDRD
jgi:hypothetical protein